MKNILLAVGLAFLGSLSACAPKVNVEQRANVNFNQYRTYDFADTEVKTSGDRNPLLRSPIAQDRIKQAIASELGKRGLRQVERNPDFLITTHTFIEQAERTVYDNQPAAGFAYPYAVSYRGGFLPVNYGYWYGPSYYSSPRTMQYHEGTLVIDFIDRRTNNLVWRGSIADPIDDAGRLGSEFSKNAKEILDKFPIEKKS